MLFQITVNGYNYLLTLPKNAINIQIKNDNAKNFMAIKDSLGMQLTYYI